jgi:hypothetical protein
MNIKKLLITESEKKSILKQYGLVVEDYSSPTNVLEVEKDIKFKGGYWKMTPEVKTMLDSEISKIKEFLTTTKGIPHIVSIKISSQESKIPNVDREGGKTTRINPGVLSNNRSETIKQYLNQALTPLVGNGLQSLPVFDVEPPKEGTTKWIGQDFCPANQVPSNDPQGYICSDLNFQPKKDNKIITNWSKGKGTLNTDGTYAGGVYSQLANTYVTEQNMTMKIDLIDMSYVKGCLNKLQIYLNYTKTEVGHTCNSAVFKVYVNGVPLKRADGAEYASLNTADDEYDNNPGTCSSVKQIKGNINSLKPTHYKSSGGGKGPKCKRFNKFEIGPELATELLSKSKFNTNNQEPEFSIEVECLKDDFYDANSKTWGGCHDGVGDIVVINGLGKRSDYSSSTPRGYQEKLEVLKMGPCGNYM